MPASRRSRRHAPTARPPPNPAHQLDYVRFISDAITQFQHDQTQILRRANPAWWLTHNGTGRHLDYRGDFTRDLDLLGFANQPMAEPDPARRHQRQAWRLDQARGWSGNFIVTGQQAGPGGQPHCLHDNPEPGEMRQMAYAAIARGADSLLLARWRTCRVGAEKLHGGLLDHDNLPRRRYAEAAQLGRELATLGPALQDTTVFIDAAVASCDLAVATAHAHYSLGLPSPDEAAATLHAALHELGYAVGVVHPADDLTGIKLYVIPHWNLFDPAWLPNLRHFVETGGTLVLGARCGSHGLHANVVAETFPGCLRELAGATVEEYGRQNAPQARPLTLAFNCCEGAVASEWWHETLRPATPETEIHATWKGQHLTGQTAATRHRLGKGCVIYVGTWFTPELVRAMLPHLVLQASLQKPWPAAPAGVEVVRRQKDGHRLWFFLNHNDAAVAIPSTPVGTDLLTGRHTDGGELPLGRHGAAVVHEELATPA
jgi:beta-galactosidase